MKDTSAMKREEQLCAKMLCKEFERTHGSVSWSPGPDPPDLDFRVDHELWGVEVAGLVPRRQVIDRAPGRANRVETLSERAFLFRNLSLGEKLQAECSGWASGAYHLNIEGELSPTEYTNAFRAGVTFLRSGAKGPQVLLRRERVVIEQVKEDGPLVVAALPLHVAEDILKDQREMLSAELDDKLSSLQSWAASYAVRALCFWTDASWYTEDEMRRVLSNYRNPIAPCDVIYVAVSVGWNDATLIQIYP